MPRTLLRYISVRDTCMLRGGRLYCSPILENTCVFVISSELCSGENKVLYLASFLLLAKLVTPNVTMTDEASPPTATAFAVSLKLPDFWPSDPELWFAQAEALFTAQNVTQEKTKFGHVVRVQPARYASKVRDIILRPPEQPYKVLKAELTKRVCIRAITN